MSRKKTVWGE